MRAIVLGALLVATPCLAQTPSATPMGPPPAPQPAPMNVRTTGDLLALCSTPATDPRYPNAVGLCVGYESGVLDYHLADTWRNKRSRRICLPGQVPTRGTARSGFVTWASAHPEDADEPAVDGVMRYLMSAYPCRR
jgi:hypothetical protein